MSKHNRAATRNGHHRQAIRQVLGDVPADLLTGSFEDRGAVAEPAPAVAAAPPTEEKARQRRGWFGLARRQSEGRGQEAAQPAALHHQAFEIERRAQRLEEALAAARDDLGAATCELDEVHQRLAAVEADLAAARSHGAEWQDTATQLNQLVDELRTTHEQLRGEYAALTATLESEQQGRQHWERVASEQMGALDELGAQLSGAGTDLHAEREAHQQTRLWAEDAQGRLSELQAHWERREAEVEELLTRERDEYHHTLEDERHTAERAHAEQAARHRDQVEQFQAEASAAITGLQQQVADGRAAIEAATAELGAARADIVRVTEDLEAARGEAVAATARAREADELRMAAELRVEELNEELAYVRSEVMGSAGGRKKPKGLFGRRPSPVKAAERQSRAAVVNNDVAAPAVDPDVDDIIERRLFGSA
jgi:chromosome segregation ATPase